MIGTASPRGRRKLRRDSIARRDQSRAARALDRLSTCGRRRGQREKLRRRRERPTNRRDGGKRSYRRPRTEEPTHEKEAKNARAGDLLQCNAGRGVCITGM